MIRPVLHDLHALAFAAATRDHPIVATEFEVPQEALIFPDGSVSSAPSRRAVSRPEPRTEERTDGPTEGRTGRAE